MIDHIARYPRLRDRSIFVGNPDDIVPDGFGPDLPLIRDWTERALRLLRLRDRLRSASFADRAALRAELGYRPTRAVCIVTVGGSGVGGPLLRRVIESFPRGEAARADAADDRRRRAAHRSRLAAQPTGWRCTPYVHDLYRHLAACDIAVVQGGLTTAWSSTANRRPFLYFPLRHHFEQNFHVRHRLERYGAGRCMDYRNRDAETIAEAIARELKRTIDYKPVETDGAARAAARIAELVSMHWSVGAAGRNVSLGGRRSAAQRVADTDRWVAPPARPESL